MRLNKRHKNWQKVVGIGELIDEFLILEKKSKGDLEITQIIQRDIRKTLILECGCEYVITGYGHKITQKKLDCWHSDCKKPYIK